MLSRIFRPAPKWQSQKAKKRIEALATLNITEEKDLEVLLRLAREDNEPAVRREAVKYLHDADVITQIQKRDLDPVVREMACQRLHDLLAGKQPGPMTLAQRIERVQRITAAPTLIQLIREADGIEIKLAALAQLSDEMYLDDIARHSSIARLRLAAAQRITNPRILEALAEVAREKDKSVYKAIKSRLDLITQGNKNERLLQEKREALCTAMETHARSALNPLYAAKAENLRQQWQEQHGNEDAALSERFETAFALAWKPVSEANAREQRSADEAQAREEMRESVETLESTLQEYHGQDDFDLPSLAALRKTQRLRWELATQLQNPTPDMAARHDKATGALENLEQLLTQWQQDKPVIAATLTGLDTMSAEEKTLSLQTLALTLSSYQAYNLPLPLLLCSIPEQPAQVSAEKKLAAPAKNDSAREKFQHLLAALATSVEAGNSRDASKQLRRAKEFAREQHLHDPRLGELSECVLELKSWAGFAVQPKKETLISEMQALIEHEMDPDDKADAIHALQESWKALGVADAAIEQPLWERFKSAGDKAFEPCRVHFATQRELRLLNLKKRMALCAQLEGYQAALPERIDWKNHEAILRTARKEWPQYIPVDRHKNLPVQERFTQALQALEGLLQEVQKKNENQKLELISKVQTLATISDLRAACDQTKKLQQQWKGIGPAHAIVERKLWETFRAACDTLFALRDAELKARNLARDAALQQAQELIASYEQLAISPDISLKSAAATLEEAFNALTLPREKATALRDKFNAARQHVGQAQREQLASASIARREAVIRSWESRQSAEKNDENSNKVAEKVKAETLLLDMEIMLGLPSPEDQQQARRERQILLLQKKGLRSAAESNQGKALLDDFLKTGPVAQEAKAALAARLRSILLKQEE